MYANGHTWNASASLRSREAVLLHVHDEQNKTELGQLTGSWLLTQLKSGKLVCPTKSGRELLGRQVTETEQETRLVQRRLQARTAEGQDTVLA